MASLNDRLRRWRRIAKGLLPYVRRREYRLLVERYESATAALAELPAPAAQAAMRTLHQRERRSDELCLFVSHGVTPSPKNHVVHHLQLFSTAGFDVVLILNTDLDPGLFECATGLADHCLAVHVRENVGLDFGAWAHAAQRVPDVEAYRRVVLVNDSIVGPASQAAFASMLSRIRASAADVVGLTESLVARRHLQSFLLAFQHGALAGRGGASAFVRLMGSVRNLPTKELVIDVYETRVTEMFRAQGLRCEALFPALSPDTLGTDDTIRHWERLMALGFPYVKASVLRNIHPDRRLHALLPRDLLQVWEREQAR